MTTETKTPEWKRIVELFHREGWPEPSWRLRDELVCHLVAYDELARLRKEAADNGEGMVLKMSEDGTFKVKRDQPFMIPTSTSIRKLREALRPFVEAAPHTRVFLTTREKMHSNGVAIFDEDVMRARAALNPNDTWRCECQLVRQRGWFGWALPMVREYTLTNLQNGMQIAGLDEDGIKIAQEHLAIVEP